MHANILKRRSYIKALIEKGIDIDGKKRREIAIMFACSPSAVSADYQAMAGKKADDRFTIHVSASMRKYIYKRDGRACQYCGSLQSRNYVIEHVIPASMGGVASTSNLVVACASCNSKKRLRVWIPRNIDKITRGNPEWRKLIIEKASTDDESPKE